MMARLRAWLARTAGGSDLRGNILSREEVDHLQEGQLITVRGIEGLERSCLVILRDLDAIEGKLGEVAIVGRMVSHVANELDELKRRLGAAGLLG